MDIIAFDFNPKYDSSYHSQAKETLRTSMSPGELKKVSPSVYKSVWGGSDMKYVVNGFFWISLLATPFLFVGIKKWMSWGIRIEKKE